MDDKWENPHGHGRAAEQTLILLCMVVAILVVMVRVTKYIQNGACVSMNIIWVIACIVHVCV